MQDTKSWNWDPGKRVVIDAAKCSDGVQWLEELYVSPDGERCAAVACTDEAEFGICVNGEFGEDRYEKAIIPRFTPDGKFAALVSQDMEWFVNVDGENWPEGYGFIWDMKFAGDSISVAVQQDMRYGMALNGETWENLFDNANQFAISPDGKSVGCAVQVEPMGQAEIFKFQSGVYSVAVNGKVWDERFVNCYTPVFNADGSKCAAQVRRSLYDYTIAVNGKVWDKNYNCVWEPVFDPSDGSVVAPVRIAGKWGLDKDGQTFWEPKWTQLWQEQFSADGKNLFAICAPSYGNFTVIKNKASWNPAFPSVTDLVVAPNGESAAVIGRNKDATYQMMVDGKVLDAKYDMLWPAVFSPDSAHVAFLAEKDGQFTIVVDGKPYSESFDRAFMPAFSPDSDKVLIKGVKGTEVSRTVAGLGDF